MPVRWQLLESAPPGLAVMAMSSNRPRKIPFRLRQSVLALSRGGVIACPTEAVWGLSCDPLNEAAIERVLSLKNRPADKGLILVAADEAQLEFLLHDLPQPLRQKVTMSWPGPNTWLLPHHGRVPELVHGRFSSVAARVSGHPMVRELCRQFGSPLVSTSANPAGMPAPKDLFTVRRYFGHRLDEVLPGAVGNTDRPSTIRDVFTDEVLRA